MDSGCRVGSELTRGPATCFRGFAAFCGHEDPETALQALIRLRAGDANAVVLSYQDHLLRQGLSPNSINLRCAALRSAVKTARRLGLSTLTLDVPGLRVVSYRDTRGPGVQAISQVMHQLEGKGTEKAARDRCLVDMLFDLALRRREALQIDLKDLNLDAKTVPIIGKGRREPELRTLPDQTIAAIRDWLADRGTEEGPLFISLDRKRTGGRLTGQAAWAVAKGLGLRHSLSLRHASITTALDLSHGNVREVRQHSRHASIQTLLLYDDARIDAAGKLAAMVATART
jgi:integrase/recombinase XerC